MKQELVQLAKDKGFVATFVHDKPFIYSSKEPLRWLFWMTELQKWLRDNHNIQFHIDYNLHFNKYALHFQNPTTKQLGFSVIRESFITFEEALEAGLFEALKLLKDIE